MKGSSEMPRCSYAELNQGLDQLYLTRLIPGETIHDRMQAVEKLIALSGWTTDLIILELIKETDTIAVPKMN